jgi:hypothetical protein
VTTLTTFEIRADRWIHGCHVPAGQHAAIERTEPARYSAMDAAAALAAFAADRPDICTHDVNRQGWRLTCVTPGAGEPPTRRLMNWEKDPDAEVSDGWLSNIAAAGNNLADRLEWEPQFCTHAHRLIPCPACGQPLREFSSKWGGFYRCTACGWKAGTTTKKAGSAEAQARIAGWCGTPLEVRYNQHGVPYPGCPTCDPNHRPATVNDIYHGRR